MDFLSTPLRRRILFTALYLSEGAPIGFLWLALPTRLKSAMVPIEQITALTAALVIPWTFKFAWAPLIDVLQSGRWTLKHWILLAQFLMGATLMPLIWIDPISSMKLIGLLLLLHAFAAATQDVAIDALCISVTDATERGRLNGWMQTGMLAGRAAMGGGALLLGSRIGDSAVVAMLVAITTFSGCLLLGAKLPQRSSEMTSQSPSTGTIAGSARLMARDLFGAIRGRRFWVGIAFALTGPAAFKAFEVVIGPFLIDRGLTKEDVGSFTAVVMIGAMVAGSLIGGRLADRFSRKGFVASSLGFIIATLITLSITDIMTGQSGGTHLLFLIAVTAFGIGLFTVAAYAMFMDLTEPRIAATQFSAFMGATNGCEAWSTLLMGQLIAGFGYATGILSLCGVSLASLLLLLALPGNGSQVSVKTTPSETT